jgi:copper chaperone
VLISLNKVPLPKGSIYLQERLWFSVLDWHPGYNYYTRRKGAAMEKQTFNIPNISCGHCTSAIETELKEIEGIDHVQSNVADKSVTVQWRAPASLEKIVATLKEINYPAAL